MTPDTIRRLGEALYGPRWQMPLARLMGVSRQTVVGWASGIYVPTGSRGPAAREAVLARIKELRAILRRL